MNKHVPIAVLAIAAALLSGCNNNTQGATNIGLVDVGRITSNWPKFLNYQNQLNADAAAIQQSHDSAADKQREMAQLNSRFQLGQTELTNDVRFAAQQVASNRHLEIVLTRQYVGYGGVDITPDVEQILHITERASPAP